MSDEAYDQLRKVEDMLSSIKISSNSSGKLLSPCINRIAVLLDDLSSDSYDRDCIAIQKHMVTHGFIPNFGMKYTDCCYTIVKNNLIYVKKYNYSILSLASTLTLHSEGSSNWGVTCDNVEDLHYEEPTPIDPKVELVDGCYACEVTQVGTLFGICGNRYIDAELLQSALNEFKVQPQ